MEKKNRPLQAANSDIRVSDITPLTKSLQAPKRTPKKASCQSLYAAYWYRGMDRK